MKYSISMAGRSHVYARAFAAGIVLVSTISVSAAELEKVKTETQEAWSAIKDYSADQRDEALQKAGDAVQTLDQRIEAWEAKGEAQWDDMSVAAREKWRATLKSMRKERNQLAEWYGALKHSSSGTWEDVKSLVL